MFTSLYDKYNTNYELKVDNFYNLYRVKIHKTKPRSEFSIYCIFKKILSR